MDNLLNKYYAVRGRHDDVLEELTKEVIRIIKVITAVFCIKDYWWVYEYYDGEYSREPLPQRVEDDYFPIYISKECSSGENWYHEGFPVIFFNMTDEEIFMYIALEIELAKKKDIEQKEKAKKVKLAKEKEKAKLRESAKAKLSKEERQALGI
jgi:hypothetical protein